MLATVMGVFFLMLIIGVPVAHLVMAAASIGIAMLGNSSVMLLVQQMYEGLNSYILLAVPFFIISGDIAAKGKTSEQLVRCINAFLGHIRGGLGMATIFACVMFGAITGSSMATVVAIGALMLPKLISRNYPKAYSIGMITAAGTLGVMIPPSVCMLITCVAMGTSVGQQFTAGFVPGILTAIAFCIYTLFVAKKQDIPVEPRIPMLERFKIVWECKPALLFPIIVLGSIYSGIATPTEAGVLSLVYIMFVELFVYKTTNLRELLKMVGESAVGSAALTLTVATAQVFVWFMTTAHVPDMLYNIITSGINNKYILLAAMCVLFLIVGCFTNVTNVVIILGPMLKSVMTYFGIDLIHFGIIVVMMSQIGFITPPFGICLFVAMRVADATLGEVIHGTLPFLIIMLILTAIFVLIPQISLFLPNLIYG